MTERSASLGADTAGALPPELERRIRSLEDAPEAREDFDGFSWGWMMLLGVGMPALLLLIGWLIGQ